VNVLLCLAATALGVGVSLWLVVAHRTENPAEIPLPRIVWRGVFGLALFFIIALTFSFLLEHVLLTRLLEKNDHPLIWCFSAIVVGVFVTFASNLKDLLVRERVLSGRRLVALTRVLTFIVQQVDEMTRIYLMKIIAREERKTTDRLLLEDGRKIDRLFEYFVVNIARSIAQSGAGEKTEREIRAIKSLHLTSLDTDVKLFYLLRYFGERDCRKNLSELDARFGATIRKWDWPPQYGDRRTGLHDRQSTVGDPTRTPRTYARRKIDSLNNVAFVRGEM